MQLRQKLARRRYQCQAEFAACTLTTTATHRKDGL